MIDITKNLIELKKLTIKCPQGEADLLALNLSLTANNMPTCTISISAASDVFPEIDNLCHIYFTENKETVELFSGYVVQDAQTVNTFVSHIESYRSYRIAIVTEGIAGTPPIAWTYLTNVVNGENAVIQGYKLVGTSATLGASSTANRYANNTSDIPGLILATAHAIANQNTGGDQVANLFTWDGLSIDMEEPKHIVQYITERMAALITRGSTYLQAIQQLCREFYLTIVPRKVGGVHTMHITHLPAWGEVPGSNKITTSDYFTLNMAKYSLKGREIDGLIMPFWDTAGESLTNIGQYVFYGQKTTNAGLTLEIVDKKSFEQFAGKGTKSLKYRQMAAPGWLQKGHSSSDLNIIVKRIVKEHFATYAYANSTITLSIPYALYKKFKNRVGELCSVEIFNNAAEGLDARKSDSALGSVKEAQARLRQSITANPQKTKNTSKSTLIGVIQTLGINMNFLQSKLGIQCTMVISHVRPESVHKKMAFSSDNLLYN